MLKTLYDRFAELYSDILPSNPTLASEHALAQEEELHEGNAKLTYRVVSTFDYILIRKLKIYAGCNKMCINH